MATKLTADSQPQFAAWLFRAPRPLGFAASETQAAIGDAKGASWTVPLSQNGDLSRMLTELRNTPDLRAWTPDATAAATRLARLGLEPSGRFPWLHDATVAHSATRPGTAHWTRGDVESGPKGAARVAVATARLMVELQDGAPNDTRAAVLTATGHEQLWRSRAATGIRIDEELLKATLAQLEGDRRTWAQTLGIDLIATDDDAGAGRVHAWLAEVGIEIRDDRGHPTLDRDFYDDALIPDTDAACERWGAFRKVRSLKSRLGKCFEIRAANRGGRIYPAFRPYRQRSGRMTIARPALQNVTPALRPILMADPGHVLVNLDFKQAEPRVAAGLSGDANLSRDLDAGLYESLAARLWGEDARGVEEQRDRAKTALLAILYGMSAGSLARELDIPVTDARSHIDALWDSYPRLRAYRDALQTAERAGTQELLPSGRPVAAAKGPYAVLNARVQAVAADLLYAGVSRVAAELGDAALWLSIHDEVVVQVADAESERARRVLESAMPSTISGVPVTGVATVLGTRWIKT